MGKHIKSSDILKAARLRCAKYGWTRGGNYHRSDRYAGNCVGCHVRHAEGVYDAGGEVSYIPYDVYVFNDADIRNKAHALQWIDKAIELAEAAGD